MTCQKCSVSTLGCFIQRVLLHLGHFYLRVPPVNLIVFASNCAYTFEHLQLRVLCAPSASTSVVGFFYHRVLLRQSTPSCRCFQIGVLPLSVLNIRVLQSQGPSTLRSFHQSVLLPWGTSIIECFIMKELPLRTIAFTFQGTSIFILVSGTDIEQNCEQLKCLKCFNFNQNSDSQS